MYNESKKFFTASCGVHAKLLCFMGTLTKKNMHKQCKKTRIRETKRNVFLLGRHASKSLPSVNGVKLQSKYKVMGKFANVTPFTLDKPFNACQPCTCK